MKNKLIKELLLITIPIIPIVYLYLVWDKLPIEIPTHFNLEGKADGFTNKDSFVWVLSGLLAFTYLLMKFLPKIDPKNQIEQMGSKYFKIKLLLLSFITAIFCHIIYMAINPNASSSFIVLILALFFVVMGNFMQTIKPNYFLGMRTPWTLQSETV